MHTPSPMIQSLVCGLVLLFLFPLVSPAIPRQKSAPFCQDSGCVKSGEMLKDLCDYIVKNKSTFPTIYVGGYYMRDLVDGYEIFGNRQYLDTAVAYGDYLLKKQMPSGFWASGYGTVYLEIGRASCRERG